MTGYRLVFSKLHFANLICTTWQLLPNNTSCILIHITTVPSYQSICGTKSVAEIKNANGFLTFPSQQNDFAIASVRDDKIIDRKPAWGDVFWKFCCSLQLYREMAHSHGYDYSWTAVQGRTRSCALSSHRKDRQLVNKETYCWCSVKSIIHEAWVQIVDNRIMLPCKRYPVLFMLNKPMLTSTACFTIIDRCRIYKVSNS